MMNTNTRMENSTNTTPEIREIKETFGLSMMIPIKVN